MKNYELLFVIPSSITNKETATNLQEVKENISKLGGNILETLLEQPFLAKTETSKEEDSEELNNLPIIKRKLAYPIKKHRFGFYCLLNFSIEPEKIKEVDDYLKRNENIIRHLVSQAEPVTKKEIELLEKLAQRRKAEQEKKEKQQKEVEEEKVEKKEAVFEKPSKEAGEIKEKKEEKAPEKKKEEKNLEKKSEKEEAKEEKSTSKKRKKKIKLEDLEDKLDEILEDTMI